MGERDVTHSQQPQFLAIELVGGRGDEPNDPGRQTIGVSGTIAPCLECSQSTGVRRTALIFQECDGVFRAFCRAFIRSGSTLPNQAAWSI
jgi:hypothetical protein